VLVSYKLFKEYRTIQTTRARFRACRRPTTPPRWSGGDSLPLRGEPYDHSGLDHGVVLRVDEQLCAIPKHPEAHLWPSEVVTLGLLHALKGVGNRAFYRWLTRDYRALFPGLPERTRLFRLFRTHQDWTQTFLAAPTVLGVIDTYGIELIHPIREGRSPQQI